MKKPKLRSQRAIIREYRRVCKMNQANPNANHNYVQGAMQALAWCLQDNAQAPYKAFPVIKA